MYIWSILTELGGCPLAVVPLSSHILPFFHPFSRFLSLSFSSSSYSAASFSRFPNFYSSPSSSHSFYLLVLFPALFHRAGSFFPPPRRSSFCLYRQHRVFPILFAFFSAEGWEASGWRVVGGSSEGLFVDGGWRPYVVSSFSGVYTVATSLYRIYDGYTALHTQSTRTMCIAYVYIYMWVNDGTREGGGFAKGFVRVLINVVIIKLFLCAALTTPSVVLASSIWHHSTFFLFLSQFFFFAQPPTLFPIPTPYPDIILPLTLFRPRLPRRPFLLFSSSSTSSTTFAKIEREEKFFSIRRVFYYHNDSIF